MSVVKVRHCKHPCRASGRTSARPTCVHGCPLKPSIPAHKVGMRPQPKQTDPWINSALVGDGIQVCAEVHRMTHLEQVDALLRPLQPLSKMHGQPVGQFGHMHCVTCSLGLLQRTGRAALTTPLITSGQASISHTALPCVTHLHGLLQRMDRALVTRSAVQQRTGHCPSRYYLRCVTHLPGILHGSAEATLAS